MTHPLITAAILAALCTPAWAVNKCTGADGRTVYQDAACLQPPQTAPRDDIAELRAKSAKHADAEQLQKDTVANKELLREMNAQVSDGIKHRQIAAETAVRQRLAACNGVIDVAPRIGMTEQAFLSCTQFATDYRPTQINETETARGLRRQYVYQDYSPIRYVYTDRGLVTVIQR